MAAKNESLHESKESELKETFDKGWKVFKEIEGSEAATNSKETQVLFHSRITRAQSLACFRCCFRFRKKFSK